MSKRVIFNDLSLEGTGNRLKAQLDKTPNHFRWIRLYGNIGNGYIFAVIIPKDAIIEGV